MKTRKTKLSIDDGKFCPKCGNEDPKSLTYSDTVDFRGIQLEVEGLQTSKCEHCGYIWENDTQNAHNNSVIRTTYAVERDRLRAKDGLLSGSEIARIREKFILNQREAAALFGGGYNAFNKYESGEVLQSYAMDRLLRLAEAVGHPALGFLKDVSAPPKFTVVPHTAAIERKIEVDIYSAALKVVRSSYGTSQGAICKLQFQTPEVAKAERGHESYSMMTI